MKGTSAAKSRLGGSAELAMAIALDTVVAAARAATVIVVTNAQAVSGFEALGVRVLIDAGGGLNAACRQGIAAVDSGLVGVLLGDLPALRSNELATALKLAEQHPMAFVADADDVGTVLVTANRAADHAPAFGVDSRAAHLRAGYLELPIPAASGLRRDVDTLEQLDSIPRAWLGAYTSRAIQKATAAGY